MAPWVRTYWVVFVANLVTAVGMMSFLPFFPSILEELGVVGLEERAIWAGVLFGAAPLAAAVMGPIWGSVGDRFGRKLMVVRALLAITVFVGAMSLASSPWQLLALRLGQGIFSGFVPPSITLVSVTAPRAIQGRVTGSLQAALPAGAITGPLAGSAIQASFGSSGLFLFVSLAAGTSALLVSLLATESEGLGESLERFSPSSVLSSAARDLKELLALPRIRSTLGLLFTVQFGVGATGPLLLLYVEEIWSGDPGRVEPLTAWLFSSFALAGLVATPLWGRAGDRYGHYGALLVATAVTGGVLALHALTTAFVWLLVARIAIGCVAPGSNVAAYGVAATESAGERRGGAFGAVFSARALAVSLGGMSGGTLAALLGIRGLFLVAGAGLLLSLLVLAGRRRTSNRSSPA